jgi:FkbH-like protein
VSAEGVEDAMLNIMSWLEVTPGDFNAQVKALRQDLREHSGISAVERVVALARCALDENQLSKMSDLAAALRNSRAEVPGLTRLKMGLFGDGTLSLLASAIVGSGLRYRLLFETLETQYGSALLDALDPASPIRSGGLDIALVSSDPISLGLDTVATSTIAAEERVAAAFDRMRQIVDSLRSSVSGTIFVQTIPPQLEPLFGSFDRVESCSPYAMVHALNLRIERWAAQSNIVLVDIARLAESVGLESWHDPRQWHAYKLSFAAAFLPHYGETVVRTVAAARGLSRKCLVLDLDNTIWGGVIGDDGVAGIELGQGSATGEAFLAVQRMALQLRARGVILAVCSKNEDAVARSPFREHPDMLIREEDIAVFQANWSDKASNLRAIAATLNIGVDALVLLDDNPAERMQVRRELPMVGVPELPDDPALYPRTLAAAGYFDAVAFSKEDRERAAYYQANARRAATLAVSGDIGVYLASLEMICRIGAVDDVSRPRVCQLINKSNQFNLTTRRYSEEELLVGSRDQTRHMAQIRLADRFGDNGIISVLIADKRGDVWEIDTWLMSCRVLGRRVEEACLAHLVAAARNAGARELRGRYIPSRKNGMVADHYKKLGFTLLESRDEGQTLWRLTVAEHQAKELEMTIDDSLLSKEEVVG